MTMLMTLQEYLDAHHVGYQVMAHPLAYTAQEVARLQHIPGREMAKVVMVKTAEGTSMMLVLPATHRVDFTALDTVLHTQATLEEEREFRALFPDCETGAEPPFGNLFHLETLVDTSLTKDDEILFNAGSHRETLRMRYADYAELVHPRIASFARAR
jgi:Ala-tRNA(Pro) deacylase